VIVLTNNKGEELRTIYPITNNSENLFRSLFNKAALSNENKINYLEKNYRTKCDFCSNLCDELYSLKDNYCIEGENSNLKGLLIICGTCFTNENFPNDLSKDMFERSDIGKLLYGIEGKK
jgi:hypothetical protein